MFLLSPMAFYDLNTINLYIHIYMYISMLSFFFCRAMWSCLRVICRSISDRKSVSFCWGTFCPRRRGFRFANDPQCSLYYYYHHQLPQNSTTSPPLTAFKQYVVGGIFSVVFFRFFSFSLYFASNNRPRWRFPDLQKERMSVRVFSMYVLYTIIIIHL